MESDERGTVEKHNKADEGRILGEQGLVRVTPMLFTAVEAAEQLGISRSTIYGLMNCCTNWRCSEDSLPRSSRVC
jgi:predicted DNA-binding transcriptional regulator AlpA